MAKRSPSDTYLEEVAKAAESLLGRPAFSGLGCRFERETRGSLPTLVLRVFELSADAPKRVRHKTL